MSAQEYLEEYLHSRMLEIQAMKKQLHVEPAYVTSGGFREVFKSDLEAALRALKAAGRIETGETLNEEWIRAKKGGAE
ncbi:MAG: hypothetical protein MJZ77_00200 [Bacteroidales bacterium]|nr:hypothetical protein [Bacteroidales bacterium]